VAFRESAFGVRDSSRNGTPSVPYRPETAKLTLLDRGEKLSRHRAFVCLPGGTIR
jgi:hypothetical protein